MFIHENCMNHINDVMINMPASSVVDRGLGPLSG